MKHLNIPLSDEEYTRLTHNKGELSWIAFVMQLAPDEASTDLERWQQAAGEADADKREALAAAEVQRQQEASRQSQLGHVRMRVNALRKLVETEGPQYQQMLNKNLKLLEELDHAAPNP